MSISAWEMIDFMLKNTDMICFTAFLKGNDSVNIGFMTEKQ